MILLSNNINDVKAAGAAWLRAKLEQEELTLPDYDRPLKKITKKSLSPFRSQVARYGFMTAIWKNVAP